MGCRVFVILILFGFCAASSEARRTSLSSPKKGRWGLSLRCRCIVTQTSFIHPKYITNIELIISGPHCSVKEVIITVRRGNKICLDPNEKWVQKVIAFMQMRMQNSASKKRKAPKRWRFGSSKRHKHFRRPSAAGGKFAAHPSDKKQLTEIVKEYLEILQMDENLVKSHSRIFGGRQFNEYY